MASKSDLTFLELSQELPQGAIVQTGNGVMIDISALLGSGYIPVGYGAEPLSNSGVAAVLFKLRDAAAQAQTKANAVLPEGDEPLTSFPNSGFGIPNAAGNIAVQQVSNFVVPINKERVIGSN